jgi:hypothetical protein
MNLKTESRERAISELRPRHEWNAAEEILQYVVEERTHTDRQVAGR